MWRASLNSFHFCSVISVESGLFLFVVRFFADGLVYKITNLDATEYHTDEQCLSHN